MSAAAADDVDLPDINTIRRRNLRIVVERAGSIAEFCSKLDVTRQRVHVLIRPHAQRNIGDEFARRVETVYGLRKNWMDHVNTERSIIAEAFEQIERNQTSHPDKIADAIREVWRVYKDLGLGQSLESITTLGQTDQPRETEPGRRRDVSKDHAVRPGPTRRKQRKRKRK